MKKYINNKYLFNFCYYFFFFLIIFFFLGALFFFNLFGLNWQNKLHVKNM